jgi:hypothetical protein
VNGEIRVELDVFSGRPNPAWTLAPAEARELAAMIQRLRPIATRRAAIAGLGYRGFIVARIGTNGAARAWLRIGGGVVEVTEGATSSACADDGQVEGWLLDQARAHGYDALVPRTSTRES